MAGFSGIRRLIKGAGPVLDEALKGAKVIRAPVKAAAAAEKTLGMADKEARLLESFNDYLARYPGKAKDMPKWEKQMQAINPNYKLHLDRSYAAESKLYDPKELLGYIDEIEGSIKGD